MREKSGRGIASNSDPLPPATPTYMSEAITGHRRKFIPDVFFKFYQVICRGDLKFPPPTPQRPGEAITETHPPHF